MGHSNVGVGIAALKYSRFMYFRAYLCTIDTGHGALWNSILCCLNSHGNMPLKPHFKALLVIPNQKRHHTRKDSVSGKAPGAQTK